MKLFGQLENAQLENKTSDYSVAPVGRMWWRTDTNKFKVDDGTNIRALLRNDGYCVFGNSGTGANNIRFHRGANGVLQFVSGADVTAEGTLSTVLNQISARVENYSNATLPAAANAGRVVWNTDLSALEVDSGAAWVSLAGSARAGAIYPWVIGSAAQVASGAATHSTWAGAIAASSAGDTIRVLSGAWTENVTISKQLYIEGSGYNSQLTGSISFVSASRCCLRGVYASNTITLDSSSNLNFVDGVWLASGISFTDNGTGNLLQGFQET